MCVRHSSFPGRVLAHPSATDVTALLVQQVASDLATFPRPTCEGGRRHDNAWTVYAQGLAQALRKLFIDARSQALSLPSLVAIFQQGSGVTLAATAGPADAVLIAFVAAYCPQRIGGGGSPTSPRDAVVVFNRQGGMWQLPSVANVLSVVWADDRWTVLVTKTLWGNRQDFEVMAGWRIQMRGESPAARGDADARAVVAWLN